MLKKISYTLISILFLFSIILNIVCVVYVYTTHTREYNEMGISFDGINTYDTDSVLASRIFLIASLSISLILLWVRKIMKNGSLSVIKHTVDRESQTE